MIVVVHSVIINSSSVSVKKMVRMEENMVNLQKLVTSLASQVTNLTSKVEDYDFKNGLLSRTVEIQQVMIRE